jgi:hypothetical protein
VVAVAGETHVRTSRRKADLVLHNCTLSVNGSESSYLED